jgi:16S rRNA U1498 N3-methylase RsmE
MCSAAAARSAKDSAKEYAKLPRLHCAQELVAGGEVVLTKDDAHYLVNVMRLQVGRMLRMFNGLV